MDVEGNYRVTARTSDRRLDRLDREELNRQVNQHIRAMRDLAHELYRVAGFEKVSRVTIQVLQAARDHVNQLGSRVLVERERIGPLREGDQQGLQRVMRCAHDAQRLVAVPGTCALVLDVQA